jgi:rifampicin phosphotransferase
VPGSTTPASPLVVPLSHAVDSATVGAKAANLARLLRAGLPVPDGFCVSAAAYHAHLKALGPLPSDLAELRRVIAEAPLAPELAAAIRAAFARLGTTRIAVRSSGTAEDLPGHSFAGLYDTFLEPNADAEACLRLIKSCWASNWTERAFEYREKNRFDHTKSGMAVLMQRLVQADAAGVAFTADPVSRRRDCVVIETVAGLGDKLVSGQAVPDRFILARPRLKVVERSVVAAPVIDERACQSIARLCLKAEKLFGSPQDVEWAAERGRVVLLQSRPITTLGRPKSWEDRQVWSNTNTAEVLPGVLTPMVWSTSGDYVGELLGSVVARIGISFGEHPFIGEVAGRIYTNLNTFTGMVRRIPFASRMDQAQMFGGQDLKPEDRARLELGPDDVPDIRVSPLRTMVKLPGFLLWISRHGPGRGRRWIDEAIAAYEKKPRLDLARFSETKLSAKAVVTMEQMMVGGEGLGYALTGMMFTSVLYDLCRRWFKDRTGTNASRLLAGTGELQSANAGLDLWRLTRSATPDVRDILLAHGTWSQVRPQLEFSASGRDFITRWDTFLHRHGHHGRGEMDMYNPRWREQPDYVLDVVRNFIRAGNKTDPEAGQRRHAEERERLTRELLARLRNPVKRWVFGYVVRQAQLSAAIRENVKDAAIRIIADTHELLVELGRRLAERGVLADADDIFFLRLEETGPVTSGKPGFDVRARVAERRAEYQRNLALNPPAIIVGPYDPAKHKPDSIDLTLETLTGLAVSPGIVRGPARVILHAGEGQVLPGEILVAPFTDPGWTPYFIPAAGIVMDQGGLLSHGSIVAREYGIPAVVNVGPATRLIKTGQMIEVDGDRGQVRILAPSNPAV